MCGKTLDAQLPSSDAPAATASRREKAYCSKRNWSRIFEGGLSGITRQTL